MRVIDTDTLIDHLRGVDAATEYIANVLLADGELFISVVSISEILAGMRSEEKIATGELMALFTVQPVDELIARIAGGYFNQFSKSHRLELGDCLIAATVKLLGADLVTCNSKHYPMKDIVVSVPYERRRTKI